MDLQDYIFLFKLGWKIQEFDRVLVKKIFDGAGKAITKFFRATDTDGDGVFDSEEEICILDSPVPITLDNGYTLVNKDDEVGLGYPALRLVSAEDVLPVLQDTDFTGDGDFIVTDLDGDGYDDVLKPLPYDGDGDGLPDFQIVVDDDDNGLPDVAPTLPFYPVGSDGYNEIMSRSTDDPYTIMNKPLSKYTVTEGILFIFLMVGAFKLVGKAFRRKKVV